MISTDIDMFRRLSEQEHQERLRVFDELIPKLTSYIRSQASWKATKLPVSYVGKDDLIEIGNIATWVAVLRWDGKRSLVNWAERMIWSRMNVMFSGLYRKKRTARVLVQGQEVTTQPLSLEDVGGALEGESVDPLETLVAEEIYGKAREQLLRRGKRVEAGVLRSLVEPDSELLELCERDAMRKGRKQVRLTSDCIASRLGVTTSRVTNAKVMIRAIFKELWE